MNTIVASRPPAGNEPVDEAVLIARAYLGRVAEPGSLAVAAFVIQHGPLEAARLIRDAEVPPAVAAATAARREHSEGIDDLVAAERHGIRLVVPESPDWPQFAFAALYAAQERRLAAWSAGVRATRYGGEPTVPLGLWVKGVLPVAEMALRSVAVVGARAATAYGEHVAVEFGYGLAAQDVTVVSGGAFGIDAAAHRGALSAGGRTVVISAGGLDRPYPSAHAPLFAEVAAAGLLISESPPGCAPQRHRFLSRNRIIAALSSATVVVEAAARSGALNTAAHCAALGRPLLVVPGPVTSAMSVGCHALLIRDESTARLVTSVEQIMAVLGPADRPRIDASEPAAVPAGQRQQAYDDLDPIARSVLDGLPARRWATEDELATLSGVDVRAVLQAVPVLRMTGLIEAGREGYRLRSTGSA